MRRMLLEEAKQGKKVWGIEEIKGKFREWYGIEVDDMYFNEAIENLIEEKLLERKNSTLVVNA